MIKINENFLELQESYLFSTVAKKVAEYTKKNPEKEVIKLGIGDVTKPIVPACIEAMHKAVDEIGTKEGFKGYGPEQGYDFLRKAIVENDYKARNIDISEDEILNVVDFVIEQQKAKYDEKLLDLEKKDVSSKLEKEEYDDPLYDEIVEYVIATQKVSASSLQRKYRLGYNRAARIVDLLEERGIIGPANGSKPREVLVKKENIDEEE